MREKEGEGEGNWSRSVAYHQKLVYLNVAYKAAGKTKSLQFHDDYQLRRRLLGQNVETETIRGVTE